MSFTVLMFIYCIISLVWDFPVNTYSVLIMLLMTSCVAVLMFFTDKLKIKNRLLIILVDLAIICFVVFGLGALFEVFPFEPSYIFTILGMILAIYFSVTGLLMIRTRADVLKINEKLKIINGKETGDTNE